MATELSPEYSTTGTTSPGGTGYSQLLVLICAGLWGCLGLLLGGTRNILSTLVFGLSLGLDGSLKRKECLRMFFSVL